MVKKLGLLAGLLVLCLFAISFVTAIAEPPIYGTLVCGIVYWQDTLDPVAGATVTGECYSSNGSISSGDPVLTNTDGTYCAGMVWTGDPPIECLDGDTVVVTAEKDGASGTSSGIVHGGMVGNLNIAVVNVWIPEFSTVTAGIALIGAGMGFIFLRRRK